MVHVVESQSECAHLTNASMTYIHCVKHSMGLANIIHSPAV
jgi:hypothetical protein